MVNFETLLNNLKMLDHPATGCFFIWSNKRTGDFQCHRLDRVIINESRMDIPSISKVEFLEIDILNLLISIL